MRGVLLLGPLFMLAGFGPPALPAPDGAAHVILARYEPQQTPCPPDGPGRASQDFAMAYTAGQQALSAKNYTKAIALGAQAETLASNDKARDGALSLQMNAAILARDTAAAEAALAKREALPCRSAAEQQSLAMSRNLIAKLKASAGN